MPKIIHPLAGAIALLTIATFWTSTLISELFGSHAMIAQVKSLIPWGFLILIPAMATVGATGFRYAKKRRGPIVEAKRKRMPIIALNGLLILVPAAFYLASKAQAGQFDTAFYIVQGIEVIAGATNIVLLGMSMRDGMRLTGKLRRSPTGSR